MMEQEKPNQKLKVTIPMEKLTTYFRKDTTPKDIQAYILKLLEEDRIRKFAALETKKLSPDIPYEKIEGLRLEARSKLAERKPMSLGQASRISGVSPADIAVLLVYLEAKKREEREERKEKNDG